MSIDLLTPVSHTPFEHKCCSLRNTYDVVAAVVVPIFLAVAVGLTIYYALNPIHMVPITSTFSMSLPLLITSSFGTVFCIMMVVQCVRCKHVIHPCVKPFRGMLRESLHLNGRIGLTVEEYKEQNEDDLNGITYEVAHFQARDGVKLGGLWHFNSKESPTVILFYGNGMEAIQCHDEWWGEYYINKNYNILVVEYRGYGMSEGKAASINQEMEAYYDAEAGLKFVLDQGIPKEKIIAHGTSLGGAYAAALGYFFDIPKVVLDHTFTNLGDVASHFTRVVPRWITHILAHFSYEQSEMPRAPFGVKHLKTDGFNTLEKVRRMAGEVFIAQGREDHLMPQKFGRQLVKAKYSTQEEQKEHFVLVVSGSHNGYDLDEITPTLESFLN